MTRVAALIAVACCGWAITRRRANRPLAARLEALGQAPVPPPPTAGLYLDQTAHPMRSTQWWAEQHIIHRAVNGAWPAEAGR